jgi:hypothetical protein
MSMHLLERKIRDSGCQKLSFSVKVRYVFIKIERFRRFGTREQYCYPKETARAWAASAGTQKPLNCARLLAADNV